MPRPTARPGGGRHENAQKAQKRFGVVRRKAFDAGGNALPAGATPQIDRLYTGQVWDAAAQMYSYNARFYDPKAARFLTMDPVREYMNPYAYIRWKPTILADPTGMVSEGSAALGIQMAYNAGLGPDDENPCLACALASAALAASVYGGTSGVQSGGGFSGVGLSETIQGIVASTVSAMVANPAIAAALDAGIRTGFTATPTDIAMNQSPLSVSNALLSGSFGFADGASVFFGVGETLSGGADITGYLGLFSGWDTGEGHLGGATAYGGFLRAGCMGVGIGGDQTGSRAWGLGAGAGLGVFVSNAMSPRELERNFSAFLVSVGKISTELATDGTVWTLQFLVSPWGQSLSGALLTTFTNPGSTHGAPR